MTNPYPKTILDDASGIPMKNDLHEAYKAGMKEVVEFVHRICQSQPSAMSWNFRRRWQVKLKDWGIE